MGFSDIAAGAALTVALPLGLFGVVVLWGFFERKPARTFGGISKRDSLEAAGRPQIEALNARVEPGGGPGEGPLG